MNLAEPFFRELVVREDAAANGFENMGRDLALLDDLPLGALRIRVYRWDGLWVTLGRNQKPEEALLNPAMVPHVVRPTGGKAVLHGHDATVALALAWDGASGDSRSLRRLYRCLTVPLARALTRCGRPAVLAEDRADAVREGLVAPDCFFGTSRNDVVDPASGRKVCGCALRVWRDRVLLQASIPAGPPLRAPSEVFLPPFHAGLDTPWDTDGLAEALRAELAVRPIG